MLLGALGTATAVLTILWLTVPGWTYNLADGSSHLLDHLAQRTGVDPIRFLPSSVRPRTATRLVPLATIVALPLLWSLRRGPRRAAASLGAALALLAVPALLVAAATVPTQVVELEDPVATKSGGWLHPAKWTFFRPRFKGGWALPEGEAITVPVVPGGEQVVGRLTVRFDRRNDRLATLRIRVGDQVVERWRPTDGEWTRLRFGPIDWPPGAEIVIEARPEHRRRPSVYVVDRLELGWR